MRARFRWSSETTNGFFLGRPLFRLMMISILFLSKHNSKSLEQERNEYSLQREKQEAICQANCEEAANCRPCYWRQDPKELRVFKGEASWASQTVANGLEEIDASLYCSQAQGPLAMDICQASSIFSINWDLIHRANILSSRIMLAEIVLSGFGTGEQHLKVATLIFQNIFPAIGIHTVKLSSCQRIVLLNYDRETKLIDLRHYSIRLQPVGVSRRIRKFVQNHQVPDLRSLQDVSDLVPKAGYGSESDADDEAATVNLSSDIGRVNRASTKSAVKLEEIGPNSSRLNRGCVLVTSFSVNTVFFSIISPSNLKQKTFFLLLVKLDVGG
ncbi:hypothetical protein RND71_000984 [Anisodus tanguticus]|uniref:Brix domain-containing protein n=1 Tax=Anisodus tanguticus TaxID=243964 RepID=A0AAE1SZZ8_9SOLA|nr:hypothetical protein RND71_000984 [Anisodus tanguticus]